MKRGQIDFPLVTFIMVVIVLLMLAPFVLKIYNGIRQPLVNQFGNVTGGTAAATSVQHILTTTTNMWDKLTFTAFIIALVLLIISAFLIDAHPFWIILYILISMFIFLILPNLLHSIDLIYTNANFIIEQGQLPWMDALRIHLGEVLIGVYIFTAVIMYGKVKFFSSKKGKGGY